MTTFDEPATDHDLRCPELTDPQLMPDPDRCTCRGPDGKTPRASWVDGPMCGFDLESTGPDPETARIVTATVVRIRPGHDKIVTEWLSDVDGEDIPAEATAVHGITTEHAHTHGRPHADVVREIRTALELEWAAKIPVVGWNLSYDLTVAARECGRAGHPKRFRVTGNVVDGLVIDKAAHRFRKGKRTLTAAAEHYRVELSEEDAHSSAADALAAARIVWRIARQRHAWVGDLTLDELHRRQIRWYADQQRSFADYLREKVAPGVVDEVERAAVLAKANAAEQQAAGWPLRVITGGTP